MIIHINSDKFIFTYFPGGEFKGRIGSFDSPERLLTEKLINSYQKVTSSVDQIIRAYVCLCYGVDPSSNSKYAARSLSDIVYYLVRSKVRVPAMLSTCVMSRADNK